MKKFIISLLILTVIACQRPVDKISLNVEVEGMSCSKSCAPFIKKNLKKTKGILEAEVSYDRKLANIIFNRSIISKEDIIRKIESIAGGIYKASVIKETKIESDSNESTRQKTLNRIDFNITKPELSHSSGFQLPNLFSLLNSILK
jgi:copper chaperone CopZ